MATKQKDEQQHSGFENVEQVLSRTEKYIEDNQKSLTIILGVILVLVALFVGYKRFILTPKESEAQAQMFVAEKYFEADSFKIALNGDGNYLGFIDIIDQYGVTKSANLACYYAGICYLHIGEYENAIEYLEDFDSDDKVVSMIAYGAIGDSYVQLDQLDDAASYYVKAVSQKPNDLTTPIYLMKLGQVYEKNNQYEKALKAYQRIKKEFSMSAEGRFIDKYIAQVEIKLKK
jgi:tetratricopeptide (TPR) repeat protein